MLSIHSLAAVSALNFPLEEHVAVVFALVLLQQIPPFKSVIAKVADEVPSFAALVSAVPVEMLFVFVGQTAFQAAESTVFRDVKVDI